jgi:6-phosphofructokinase
MPELSLCYACIFIELLDFLININNAYVNRYIDPSYMIRSVPANGADSLYCMLLGQNAVHGAFAGFTGFSVGLCSNCVVYLPISALVANSPRAMDPQVRNMMMKRIIFCTLSLILDCAHL